MQFLKEHKSKIFDSIVDTLEKKSNDFAKVNFWGKDFKLKVIDFVENGKMIRGSLVIFAYKMFNNILSEEIIKAASVMELFHSSLLIHDDIMDNDFIRRGKDAIFAQYEKIGKNKSFNDPHGFGIGMGICVGDLIFFISYELLTNLGIDSHVINKIINLCSRELVNVGLAQMQDLYFGYSKDENVNEEEILKLYLYKTARYTFTLPLLLGAILAEQNEKVLNKLEIIGDNLGLIFQIKDDEIEIFGSEKKIGKPLFSDLKEGKKTIIYYYLHKNANEKEKKILKEILNKEITSEAAEYVRNLIIKLGIKNILDKKIKSLELETRAAIDTLKIDIEYKNIFYEILDYNSNRNN